MSPINRVLPRQFSLREATAFLSLAAIGFGALKMRLYPASMVMMGALIGWSLSIVFACRKRLILFASIGAILFPVVSSPFWVDAWVRSVRRGPVHTFLLDPPPKFLAEDTAIDRARETLTLDGFSLDEWKPQEDGRSKSPEGIVDKYLNRNTLNSNRCSIVFVKADGSASRIVVLELIGTQLETYVWIPK